MHRNFDFFGGGAMSVQLLQNVLYFLSLKNNLYWGHGCVQVVGLLALYSDDPAVIL